MKMKREAERSKEDKKGGVSRREKGATHTVGHVTDISDSADSVFVVKVFYVDSIPSGPGLM